MGEKRERKLKPRRRNAATGLTYAEIAFLEAFNRLKKNGSAAYKEIHPACNDATARWAANAILKRPHVVAFLARLEMQAQYACTCTLEDHIQTLAALRNLAIKDRAWREAIRAEELRGQASGHYRVDVTLHHRLTPETAKTIDLAICTEDELADIAVGDISDQLFSRLTASARAAEATSEGTPAT